MSVVPRSTAPSRRATPPPTAAWITAPDADGRGGIIAIPDGKGRTTPYDLVEVLCEFPNARGFALCKHTPDREEYFVLLANNPQDESCDCAGFLRWNHCKHTAALRSLIGGQS
jgi:hypothetical protein